MGVRSNAEIGRARIGVVTVSYRSAEVLVPMLASLPSAGRNLAPIVIADNHPETSIADIARQTGAEYLPLDNRGYGAAVNAAVRLLPSDVAWILVSNPDVVFEPSAIDRMFAVGDADDSVGAVGPRIIDDDGLVYPSARSLPSLRMGIGHALFSRIWPSNPWTRRYLRTEESTLDEIRDAGWLSGACILVRRSAFDRVGGFDEEFFMYFEDVDLGRRLGRAGFRNVYVPEARIHHVGGHSTGAVSELMLMAHHRSAELFIARKYPGPALAPLRVALRLGLRARARLLRASGRRG